MREFVIGDIHGCAGALRALLDLVQPEKTDTFVFLGDYIDRGPDSCAVVDTIIRLHQACNVIAIAGNHEKMLLESRESTAALKEWLVQGGRATLESYTRHGQGEGLAAVPPNHWEFLAERTRAYWETDKHIFVHASLDPDLDMDKQPDWLLLWQTFSDPTRHKSGKQIVCGHTAQRTGWPARFDGGICIDTYAYGGGWLTCFETTKRSFWQTNELGGHRTFDLDTLLRP
jgi:serine/threonine protein phosphatase 1